MFGSGDESSSMIRERMTISVELVKEARELPYVF
jgi:hypothetical protein